VPTTRPRHIVTETDELAAALDAAAQRWPEDRDRRSRLLLRLVDAGHRLLQDEVEQGRRHRRDAVLRNAGALGGAYGPDYLTNLRRDWPQ
jgi:hypothetical protein